MKRNQKKFARVMGILLSLTMLLLYGQTALAAKKDGDFPNVGAGMLFEPNGNDTTERISKMAQTMNLDIDAFSKPQAESKLVMANVEKELKILNKRDAKAKDAKVVGYLYKDCGGEILERKDGWTKLRSGNIVGWAEDQYLLFGEEAEKLAEDAGKKIAIVSTDVLRVRMEESTKAEMYGLLPEGERVDVLDKKTKDGWICVDYNGKDGYVSADYVDVTFQIDAGETVEEMKARQKAERAPKHYVNYGEYTVDADTTLLLAALIHCEAGGEPYEGQVAVGAVVMNRVRSAAYPNTIHGVIYASGQFTPAMSGKVNRVLESGKIYESCIRAAEEALSGVSNVGELTHFRRVNGREGLIIGNHVFY